MRCDRLDTGHAGPSTGLEVTIDVSPSSDMDYDDALANSDESNVGRRSMSFLLACRYVT